MLVICLMTRAVKSSLCRLLPSSLKGWQASVACSWHPSLSLHYQSQVLRLGQSLNPLREVSPLIFASLLRTVGAGVVYLHVHTFIAKR